jgi:hypothetical protein
MGDYAEKEWKPVLIYEVLLPKRLEYLGKLQDVLETIFAEDKIRQVPAIRAELDAQPPGSPVHRWVSDAAKIFTGYSMYEVDGRYLDPTSGQKSDERTIVIRLVIHDRAVETDLRPDFARLVDAAVRGLLGNRLSKELGTEGQIWIIRYEQAQVKIWEKRPG